MLLFISLLLLTMFSYVNALYYSIALLLVVLGLLYTLVSNLMMHSLTILLLIIVYVGAMMILIGYICAICPNLILSPKHINFIFYFIYFLLFTLFILIEYTPVVVDLFSPVTNYFYSSYGGIAFLVVVSILFITLLMVTSQYITPKGPFRSVSI